MEQAYIIARLKEITIPELLDALAEAHAGGAIDIYEHLDPALIDKTTDTLWEFISAVKKIEKWPALIKVSTKYFNVLSVFPAAYNLFTKNGANFSTICWAGIIFSPLMSYLFIYYSLKFHSYEKNTVIDDRVCLCGHSCNGTIGTKGL